MRAPVLKGLLYLGLYYIAAIVLGITFGISSAMRGQTAIALLTPAGAFEPTTSTHAVRVGSSRPPHPDRGDRNTVAGDNHPVTPRERSYGQTRNRLIKTHGGGFAFLFCNMTSNL